MSHITKCKVAITQQDIDSGVITKTLQELAKSSGYTFTVGEGYIVNDGRSAAWERHNVDIGLYRNTAQSGLGLKKNETGQFELVGDFYGYKSDLQDMFDRTLLDTKVQVAADNQGWSLIETENINQNEQVLTFEVAY